MALPIEAPEVAPGVPSRAPYVWFLGGLASSRLDRGVLPRRLSGFRGCIGFLRFRFSGGRGRRFRFDRRATENVTAACCKHRQGECQ